jgi:hypothetical protein
MEPNKLENEFKRKLNQREINPTQHAWDRLEAMLNEIEDKKVVPVRRLNWLYIAAGFIGLLLMATLFFRQKNEISVPQQQVIVEGTAPSNISSPESEAVATTDAVKENAEQEIQEKVPTQKTPTESTPVTERKIRNVASGLPKSRAVEKNTAVAGIDLQQNPEPKIIENKKTDINPVFTPADEQIADAGTTAARKPTIKVNASSLLSEVDGELELSFREKVIQAAAKNYKNVKVALANRNQE